MKKSPKEINLSMDRKKTDKRKKSLSVATIKNAIRSGHTYCSDLARFFKITKQTMSYWLKKMEKNEEIEIDIMEGKGKVAKFYRVVDTQDRQSSIEDWLVPESEQTYFRDGIQISYGILNYDKWFKPDKDWKLGTTLMKGITIDKVFIRIANDKTITFIMPKIYGKDEVEPITKADFKSYQIRDKFLKMYPDFELTPMPINMNLGHLGTTELMEVLKEYSGIKTNSFIIDKTPKKGALEMKITDPIKASENMRDTVDFFATGGIKTMLHELHSLNTLMAGFVTRNVSIENAILLIAQTLKKLEEKK